MKTYQPFILPPIHLLFPSIISMEEISKHLLTFHLPSSFQFSIENLNQVLSQLNGFSQILDSDLEQKLFLSNQFLS